MTPGDRVALFIVQDDGSDVQSFGLVDDVVSDNYGTAAFIECDGRLWAADMDATGPDATLHSCDDHGNPSWSSPCGVVRGVRDDGTVFSFLDEVA